MESINN